MIYSIVEKDIVVNQIVADEKYIDPEGRELIKDGPGVGFQRKEGKWGDPRTQEFVDHEWRDLPPPEPESLPKETLYRMADEFHRMVVLRKGFPWKGYTISCDEVSQLNATGFKTADIAKKVPYPILWRTVENVNITIDNDAELEQFSELMLFTIQTTFKEKWDVKDDIKEAKDLKRANDILFEYQRNHA